MNDVFGDQSYQNPFLLNHGWKAVRGSVMTYRLYIYYTSIMHALYMRVMRDVIRCIHRAKTKRSGAALKRGRQEITTDWMLSNFGGVLRQAISISLSPTSLCSVQINSCHLLEYDFWE